MYYSTQNEDNAIRNRITIFGGGPASYNAVLSIEFSAESTTDPVTIAEAKSWLRIDIADDDTILGILIKAARQMCEKYANISFITRTVTAIINNSCGNSFLPYGPVTGTVTYTDSDDVAITDAKLHGVDFPYLSDPANDYIKLVYPAGYADGALPENLKQAVLSQVAYLYENRGDDTKLASISPLTKTILNQVKR